MRTRILSPGVAVTLVIQLGRLQIAAVDGAFERTTRAAGRLRVVLAGFDSRC